MSLKNVSLMILSTTAIAGLFVNAAVAVGPEVIYTKIPTHPTSIVPGAKDLAGDPAVTNFRALEQLYVSPDGSRWLIIGRTQLGSDLETIALIGAGTTGTTLLQEGQPVPGSPGELIDFFGSGGGRFNEYNQLALSLRARPTSTGFQKVMVYNGDLTPDTADFEIVARGGSTPGIDLYTGLQDLSPNPSGDETIGNSIGSIHITNSGLIGAQDSTINLIHSSRRPAIFYSNAYSQGGGLVTFNSFKQAGVSTFLDMDGITNRTYGTTLSANTFYTTPDDAHWVVHGQILGAAADSDTVLIYDGQARLQEGVVVPGGTAVVHAFVTTDLIANGDYYARGTRRVAGVSDGVWASKNGQHHAQTGDPITSSATGPSENWASSFYVFTGNAQGDWLLAGRTDNPDTAIDDVVVVNGEVVLREGDPVDLDNNGLYDDNVFIGRGTNTLVALEANDATITDDGTIYLFVNLRDGQGNDLNSNPVFGTPQAFLRIVPAQPPLCLADLTNDGGVSTRDLLNLINAWGPCGECPPYCPQDFDQSCAVGTSDLQFLINNWGPCPQ